MRRTGKVTGVILSATMLSCAIAGGTIVSENKTGVQVESKEAKTAESAADESTAKATKTTKAAANSDATKEAKAKIENIIASNTSPTKVAKKVNKFENTEFEAAVNTALTNYYNQDDKKAVKEFSKAVDERADDIVKDYEEAAKERDAENALDYEACVSILTFGADATKEEIEAVVADNYGEAEYIHECTDGSYMIKVNTVGLTAKKAAEEFAEYEIVSTSEINGKVEQTAEAWDMINDPYRYNEYYLQHLNVGTAWEYINSRSHSKVKVCVIDGTGVDVNTNVDLTNVSNKSQSIVYNDDGSSYPMTSLGTYIDTSNMHMVNCAGLIAAQSNNNSQVAGVAAGTDNSIVDLVNVAIPLTVDKIALAVDYANGIGCKVVNLSLFHTGTYSYEEEAINRFTNAGGTVVAGAGNNGADLDGYPSDYGNVISIIATNEDKSRRGTSNFGWDCDFCAPGTNITVCGARNETWITNGTSMASPIAAGTVAMMYSVNMNLNKNQVHQILRETAQDLGDSGRDYYYAYGLINAGAAVRRAGGGSTVVTTTTSTQNNPSGPIEAFGLGVSSNSNNTITVVWGQNEQMINNGQTYNIYVDGNRVLAGVGCAQHVITNVSAGNHTVKVTAVLNGSETSGITGDVTVSGGTQETSQNENTNGYVNAGPNWTETNYWDVLFASGWGGDPTGSYRNGNSYSDFGIYISKAAGVDWAVQLKTKEMSVEAGKNYTVTINATSNMATSQVIRLKDDISATEQFYSLASGNNTITLNFTASATAQFVIDLGQAPVGLNMEITSFNLKNNDAETTTTTTTTTARYYPNSFNGYERIEAEHFATKQGGVIDTNANASNGYNIGGITNGVTMKYENVNFGKNAGGMKICYSSVSNSGGSAKIYCDSTDNLVGEIALPSFGDSWQNYSETEGRLSSAIPSGNHTIFVVYETNGTSYYVANVDYFTFVTEESYLKTIEGGIELNGIQISSNLPGLRVLYSVDSKINGKNVVESGVIFKMTYNGNEYTNSYSSTGNGVMDNVLSDSDIATSYAMTMRFVGQNADEYTTGYSAKAYAKLSDGSYVYTDEMSYTIYNVADGLYANRRMNSQTAHNWLYDNILSRVNGAYGRINY